MRLIKNISGGEPDDPVVMLEYIRYAQDGFLNAFPQAKAIPASNIWFKRQLLRVFRHLYFRLPLSRIVVPGATRHDDTFSIVCGNDFAYCLPQCFFSRKNYLYIFDAWPASNAELVDWCRLFSIDRIFFSALQSAELFNDSIGGDGKRGVWLPEGIDNSTYRYNSFADKDIDVLEFGRRYELYHQEIADVLQHGGYNHCYNRNADGTVHISTKQGVVDTFARSKISICFPSNITHPKRSGHISTMTLRYLESMVSKCLIVGSLPYDMEHLFDYKPVIEVDWNAPDKQITEILENFGDYIPLIEKNYETAINNHLWMHRFESIKALIST